jgi:hypothetical protein
MESEVLKSVRLYLNDHGALGLRIQPVLVKPPHGGRPFWTAQPGISDLLVVHKGRAIAIETKGAGRQQENQRAFQAAWEKHGGVYVLARSTDDLAGIL